MGPHLKSLLLPTELPFRSDLSMGFPRQVQGCVGRGQPFVLLGPSRLGCSHPSP